MMNWRMTAPVLSSALVLASSTALADNSQLQAKVAQLRAAIGQNKQMLAQYTWQQLETVSVKGDVKKQIQYQVLIGPNGQPQKTEELASQQNQGPPHGSRQRVKEKMSQDYEDYAKQIGALAQSYAQPDPARLQQLYQQGNVTAGSAGAPGTVALVIQNDIKPGDKVTVVFNQVQKSIISINVATYLSGPSDAVTIAAQFGQLGDGTNYISNLTVSGASKRMTVQDQNSNFQKR
jgi:hypothetical protein